MQPSAVAPRAPPRATTARPPSSGGELVHIAIDAATRLAYVEVPRHGTLPPRSDSSTAPSRTSPATASPPNAIARPNELTNLLGVLTPSGAPLAPGNGETDEPGFSFVARRPRPESVTSRGFVCRRGDTRGHLTAAVTTATADD